LFLRVNKIQADGKLMPNDVLPSN